MSKTVFLFPGQASQYVGMGQDLYDASDDVKRLYEIASDAMGEDLAEVSFRGPAEKLKETRYTQPAILVHSLAILTLLGDRQPEFHYAAGHSLGEYGALAVAGALTIEDAIAAVVRRAALMDAACKVTPSTMAAIIGLSDESVEAVCTEASSIGVVVPANFNSTGQIVISGEVAAVERACELAKSAGAKRAMVLEVGGAFHSPLMESARTGMAEYLASVAIHEPHRPVIANVTAEPVAAPDQIRELLVTQITAPVCWSQTIAWLKANDVTTQYELGPGKVLTGLAKRELRPTTAVTLDTLTDLEAFSTAGASS